MRISPSLKIYQRGCIRIFSVNSPKSGEYFPCDKLRLICGQIVQSLYSQRSMSVVPWLYVLYESQEHQGSTGASLIVLYIISGREISHSMASSIE